MWTTSCHRAASASSGLRSGKTACAHADVDMERHVGIDPAFFRPAEVDRLIADPTHAREGLGWQTETSFEELVAMMVDADLARLARRAQTPA